LEVVQLAASISDVVELPVENSRVVLKGCTGSGKTSLLIKRYEYMVKHLGIAGDRILVLLMNKDRCIDWERKISTVCAGFVSNTTFKEFVQEEINTYYPIILKNNPDIKCKRLKPLFLSQQISQFLLNKAVEARRKKRGVFASVAADTPSIVSCLSNNLLKAAASGIPYKEIGNRLYSSLAQKDETKKQIFADADEVIDAYRKKCLEFGMFDFAMCLELYVGCLLIDGQYVRRLHERIEHLIVDDLEESMPVQADFISLLLPNLKTCILAYNPEGGSSEDGDAYHNYLKKTILDRCDCVELGKPFTCSNSMYEFSSMLFDDTDLNKANYYVPDNICERQPAAELRSEMLEKIGERVCRLISVESYLPSDIVILSTYADAVTEYVIGGILERQGHRLINISRRDELFDNPITCSLITLAQLCHPSFGMIPEKEELCLLLRTAAGIDPVRSSILAAKALNSGQYPELLPIDSGEMLKTIGKVNIETYEFLRKWIKEYKSNGIQLPINEFLCRGFIEVMSSRNLSDEDVNRVKILIDDAAAFEESYLAFGRNEAKNFIQAVKYGFKYRNALFGVAKPYKDGCVILTTPFDFLAASINCKVIIISGIRSRNWTRRVVKELSNPYILTKTWIPGDVYSEDIEQNIQKRNLSSMMKSILRRCSEKLIIYDCELSANGYINDGLLGEYFGCVK